MAEENNEENKKEEEREENTDSKEMNEDENTDEFTTEKKEASEEPEKEGSDEDMGTDTENEDATEVKEVAESDNRKVFFPSKNIIVVILAILILGGVAGFAVSKPAVISNLMRGNFSTEKTVAMVNGEPITQRAYDERKEQVIQSFSSQGKPIVGDMANEEIKTEALDSLIAQELLLQDAAKQGIVADQSEIDTQMDQIIAQFENEEDFNARLGEENLTQEGVRASINDQMILEQYVAAVGEDIEITDQEIEDTYEELAANSEEVPELNDDVYEAIKQQLRNQKLSQAIEDRIQELRDAAEIEIYI